MSLDIWVETSSERRSGTGMAFVLFGVMGHVLMEWIPVSFVFEE